MDCDFDIWSSRPPMDLYWPLPLDSIPTADGALARHAGWHHDLDRPHVDRSISSSSSDGSSITGIPDPRLLFRQHAAVPRTLPRMPPPSGRGTSLGQIQTGCLPSPPAEPHPSSASVEVTFDGAVAWQERKATKRREQNKRYQQAYRARKERYSRSLTERIEKTNTSIRQLRDDKRELVQALCNLRAENEQLRCLLSAIDLSDADIHAFDQVMRTASCSNEMSKATRGPHRSSSSQQGLESLLGPAQIIRKF